ncbi:hypothetical protein A2U01_0001564 [Trifolium medium]|uniref:Uncharacterized protein n=1 Tax=Trifolium medium TaxID=97028 RepID=A0A392M0I5_9FABA|nr:hypothetical protein [Trifolium medium]
MHVHLQRRGRSFDYELIPNLATGWTAATRSITGPSVVTLVIPAKSVLINELHKEFHSSLNEGHSSYLRTYRRMAGTLYWQGMMKSVQDFVKACDTCQRQKGAATTPNGLLQPLPIPVLVWSEISMDFIINLPKSNGFEAILVVVYRLSKHDVENVRCLPPSDRRSNGSGFTPFEIVYGRKPPALVHFLEGETRVEAVADKKRREVKFEVGDWVFLKLRPHRQQSVVQRIHQKLAPRFFGPYQIIKKMGAVGNYSTTIELPASLEADNGDVIPAKCLSLRDKFEAGKHTREWLVQWEGMDVGDATWEEELLLKSQFPDLHLENKVVFVEGSDDRNGIGSVDGEGDVLASKNDVGPKIWRVYERRDKRGITKKV